MIAETVVTLTGPIEPSSGFKTNVNTPYKISVMTLTTALAAFNLLYQMLGTAGVRLVRSMIYSPYGYSLALLCLFVACNSICSWVYGYVSFLRSAIQV